MVIFMVIGVIIDEILDGKGGVLLKMDPWIGVIREFHFVVSIDDSLDASESSVGFIFDPSGGFVNMDGVIVVVVMVRAEREFS